MGLFARKKPESLPQSDDEQQKLYREKQEELNGIRQKVEMVKDEYQATVGSLMAVKKELNQKRLELDTAVRELAKTNEKAKKAAEITGSESIGRFNKTAEGLASIKQDLKKASKEYEKIKAETASEQSSLRIIRSQHAEYKKELDEASARLYNAKEELAKTRFQGTDSLSEQERAAIASGQSPSGVIEAASAVVASLKSKLNTAQKELETMQSLLEEERSSHEETRRKLGSKA
ncbi:MAG: DNA repair protein [Nitrosopumilus sp. H13]|nr:MAG: DNA repair protein [Nitrosopumilus sp. H13]